MAEKSTIARPYAQAAFDLAQQQGKLKEWSEMLQWLSGVAADDAVMDLVGNPEVTRDAKAKLFIDICSDKMNEQGKSFVDVLADNKRLDVLPEIAEQFEQQRAEAEMTVEAEVTTPFPMSDAQQKAMVAALKTRLGREVTLVNKTDESLIGGAIVRAGDLVIDASVTGQLARLANTLMH
jgi:F-type H+-transporting ATPase subunit delta